MLAAGEINLPEFKAVMLASLRREGFFEVTSMDDYELTNLIYIPSLELTHIPCQGMFEDDVPFPKVGYASSLEGS